MAVSGLQSSVYLYPNRVAWQPPTQPNGVITGYTLLRRGLLTESVGLTGSMDVITNMQGPSVEFGNPEVVYNGSQLQTLDSDPALKPYRYAKIIV